MLRSLRARLAIIMIIVVVLPLVVVGVVLTLRAQDVQRQQAENTEIEQAGRIAAETRAFIEVREQQLRLINDVRGLGNLPRSEQETVLLELMSFNRDFNELAFLDAGGQEIIRISRDRIVTQEDLENRGADPAYIVPVTEQVIYYSPIELDAATGTPLMTVAIPLFNLRSADVANVLIAQLRFDAIWQLLAEEEQVEGQDAYIVDASGRVVAHRNPSVVLSVTEYDVPNEVGVYPGLNGEEAVIAFETLQFGDQFLTVVTENATAQAFQPVEETRNTVTVAVIAAAIITALGAVYILTRMLRPLARLATAANQLGSGDFTVRAEASGGSELSAVANSFNNMASELQNMVDTLEARIAARTGDLQLASQLSGQVATILNPEQLLPQVVELTKSSFDLYHAHIYLFDEAQRYLMLTAGAGEPGRIMRDRGHRIDRDANSLVARAARENVPVVVNDVMADGTFMPNPLLPDTRAEAAFPLAVRGRVVGVLDVQASIPGRFDDDLQVVLQTMAGQVAVAIANAQLFAEVDRASRHEQTLSAITAAIQGANSIDEVLQTAARELGRALRVSKTAIELKLDTAANQPTKTPEPLSDPETAR